MFAIYAIVAAAQVATPPLATPQLEPLAFLAGHCWQGTFANGQVDTHCFEPVYGGRFLRDRHEVTGGERVYAGESLYGWNAEAGRVEYTYWNTSGGISRGSMVPRDGHLDFGDQVHRTRDGREIRISTAWHRVGDDAYEARSTGGADPTASRIVRYVRVDRAPVAVRESPLADGGRTLTHEVFVPAPPAQVYAAFATPEGWRSWAVPLAWRSAEDPDLFETSYQPDAAPGDARNIRQRFVLRVPDRLVAFRTVQTPTGFPHSEAFQRVTNLVELEPLGAGTRVRLSGLGYPAGAAGDALIAFFREGNRTSLEQLRTRFANGPIDWAARQRASSSAR